jgi:acyl-CoA dehydrogenase
VPEGAGGSGGDVGDACTLLRVAGRHAVPLPLAEGALLGGWLVAAAGLELPGGPISVAVPRAADRLVLEDGKVTGTLTRVPWGARVAAVVGLAAGASGPPGPTRVVVLDPAQASVRPGHNVAGEPRDALTLENAVPVQVGSPDRGDLGPELALRGALSRALLMAGAMEAVADLTVEYAAQRQQFGRPIASFQAVAQRLVRLSSEAEAGILATEVAARRFAQGGTEAGFEVAVAKASTARAASEVAAHAHQVHGAIGMTREYALHHFTRRLWTWRQEWGSEARWNRVIGEQVTAAGADALWPRVATGLVAVS